MPPKLLIVSEQLQTTQELAFDKPRLTIGRKTGNDLAFNRGEISGTHAAFLFENGECFVQDLGSTNGTFMNGGQLVAQEKYPLTPQDVVMITPYRITLLWTPDPATTLPEGVAKSPAGRIESGTMIDIGGRADVRGRVSTGTAEHESPPQKTTASPTAAPAPQPAPPPTAAPLPAAKPKPEQAKPAPPAAPPAQPKPAATKPERKPAPPKPLAPPSMAEKEEEFVDVPDLPGSAIGDYLWLAIGALCFLGAIGLILYLIFGF